VHPTTHQVAASAVSLVPLEPPLPPPPPPLPIEAASSTPLVFVAIVGELSAPLPPPRLASVAVAAISGRETTTTTEREKLERNQKQGCAR
jgi:hypothetical protein